MISILNWFDKVFNFSIHIKNDFLKWHRNQNSFEISSFLQLNGRLTTCMQREYFCCGLPFPIWYLIQIVMFFLSFFLLRFVRRTSHRWLLNSIFSLNFSGMIRNDNTSRIFFLRFFNFFFGHSFSVPKKSFLKWYILKHSNFLGW